MKNIFNLIVIDASLLTLTLFFPFSLMAQKLLNVQSGSMRLPANIKIDGKANEWDNHFQAYNKATDVYYTIANDENSLYLVIQATKPDIVARVIRGGVTFTINKSGNKNDKSPVTITYPIISRSNGSAIAFKLAEGTEESDQKMKTRQTDSLMNVLNAVFAQDAKFIQVGGMKTISDSTISIYNEEGIRVCGHFDNAKAFSYELEIPLMQLGLTNNNTGKFKYNIKLNGYSLVESRKLLKPNISGIVSVATVERSPFGSSMPGGDSSIPTDFWGEYTLAKKP